MTSYEVSIGFWAIGYTFHAFYGPFHCLSSRELLSIIPEDRMTHFVSLTVPPPRTDNSLRHTTTRVGLRATWFRILWLHKKCPFRAIFVSYSTRFSAPGSTFSKPPRFLPNPCRWHLMRFPLVFRAIGYTFHAFYRTFHCLSSRELLSTIPEDRMTHFITLTVPPPRTDHSLRHSTTMEVSGLDGFEFYDFAKNIRFGPFSWAIAHDFRHPGQLFRNLLYFFQILVDDILWGFHWFLGHRVHIPCLLRVVSLPFQPRITVNHSGGQNDTFRHSNGLSSTYRP
jgi:hypothetical protein